MHHVRVTFNEHQVFDAHGSIPGNSSQVVSSQVDQHDVLGTLFFVPVQFLGKRVILCFVLAPGARPRDRPILDFTIVNLDQHLRR